MSQTIIMIILVLSFASAVLSYKIHEKLTDSPAVASEGFDGYAGGPAKDQIEFSHRGGFFPGSPDGVNYSFAPDHDYMKKYGYIEADEIGPSVRSAALAPILGRLNAPGMTGYPYGTDTIRQYNHAVNDQVMAQRLGGRHCSNGQWATSAGDCPGPYEQYNVEGFDNDKLYSAMSGM